jgi:gamma-glutamyltranspeptidase / glutathione hydrolase
MPVSTILTKKTGVARFLFILLFSNGPIQAQPIQIISDALLMQPVRAEKAMVVTQEAQASRIGLDVLKKGGNAIDAAVAVGFALAVTLPRAGNLGGGGFMLVHLAKDKQDVAIDYRETAPATAQRDMFLDKQGNADPKKSRDSGLSVGVPGTVAGLELAYKKYGSGKVSWTELLAPAIELARNGIVISEDLADSLPQAQARLAAYPSSVKIFLKNDLSVPRSGERLIQSDLAQTLDLIARYGAAGFYQGSVAEKISAAIAGAGGEMTLGDLADYQAKLRKPVTGQYKGLTIYSMPPPSSGGVHVIEILNMLEAMSLPAQTAPDAQRLHLFVEAMKIAYADRAEYLGDPDFIKVPVAALTSKRYASDRIKEINQDKARPSREIKAGPVAPYESDQTTHYSILDEDGNAVANTYTLNFSYGLGLVADGTGVLLNNELDDFAAKAGAPNGFGLVGGDANAPAPGKRPLSSMSPTIILDKDKVMMVTGSPGGSRIISTVLNVITNVVDYKMGVLEAVAAPRIHHQWLPDEVRVERGLSPDTIRLLESKGHKVTVSASSGSAHTILVTARGIEGAADLRQRGTLAVGY